MSAQVERVVSHWYHLTEGLQESPKQFYQRVITGLQRRELPKVKALNIDFREGGILSAKREYLRIRRQDLVFDICAAPYGSGFFVSWWLGELRSGLASLLWMIPVVGPLLVRSLVRPITYYQLDTALMFQESIHSAVLETLDEVTTAKGLRTLSEVERRPIMKELLKR